MSRQPRIEFPGAFYHVYSRGNERQDIFRSEDDRRAYLSLLAKTAARFSWECLSYCLMDNHYHLLIRTLKATLSRGMHWLNGVYTQRFNRKHGRVGHLFQGRFKDTLVQDDGHLAVAHRYVALNPVEAGMTARPEDWAWSSYRAMVGLEDPASCLSLDAALASFGTCRTSAARKYTAFVLAGVGAAPPDIAVPIFGDDGFIEEQRKRLGGGILEPEYPLEHRLGPRPPLEEIIPTVGRLRADGVAERNAGAVRAVLEFGYTQKDVADYIGLHYSRISKMLAESRRT